MIPLLATKSFAVAARRLPVVGYFLLNNFWPSLCGLLVSYGVVRRSGVEVWGEYVYAGTIVSTLVLGTQWGFRDLLIREVSLYPARMVQQWYAHALPRLGLLLVGIGMCFLFFKAHIALLVALWLVLLWLVRIAEVLYVYQKRFKESLLAEMGYWAVMGTVVALPSVSLSFQLLLWATAVGLLVKGGLLYAGNQSVLFPVPPWRVNSAFMLQGFPFLALSLTGLLEARLDFLCITVVAGKAALGKYSVLFNLIVMLKNLPIFFLEPFAKNLYRSGKNVFDALIWQMSLAGLAIASIGVAGIYLVCEIGYNLQYSWLFYGMAVLYVWPRFLFTPDVYRLFQQKKERWMVAGTLLGLGFNAAITLVGVPMYGLVLAITGAAAGQWVMLGWFKWTKRILAVNTG